MREIKNKYKITIVAIVLSIAVSAGLFALGSAFSDDDVDNSSPNESINVSVNESVTEGLAEYRDRLERQGYNVTGVFLYQDREYHVATIEPVREPVKNFREAGVVYASVYENHTEMKSLVIRSEELEVVVPENTVRLYNNDSLNKEAFKETISFRIAR
jgi:hypothetical protein